MDLAGAFGANFVGDDAVEFAVDHGAEFRPEAGEGVGFEAAFEDGVLDAQPPVFTDFGDLVQAFYIGDVVGHEGE